MADLMINIPEFDAETKLILSTIEQIYNNCKVGCLSIAKDCGASDEVLLKMKDKLKL